MREKIAILKFWLQRGWSWVYVLGVGFIVVDTIERRLAWNIPFIALFLGSIFVLVVLGYIDAKAKFLQAEQNYGAETNPLLLKIYNKLEEIDKKIKTK